MTKRFRLAIIAPALTALMVVSLGHSRAAGEGFEARGPFRLSGDTAVPEALAFQGGTRPSRPSEIASGSESGYVQGQKIVLNIRPCKGGAGEFVEFHWPFRRTVVGSVKCDGSQVGIVQVEQQ